MSTLLSGCSFTESMGLTKIEPRDVENREFEDKELSNKLQGRWYYDKLSESEKRLYQKIYKGIQNWDETIELDGEDFNEVTRAFRSIQMERPELYYLGQEYDYTYYNKDTSKIYTIRPIYTLTEPEYKKQMKEIRSVVDDLKGRIESKGLGEYQAELFVHDYLVEHIDYFTDNATEPDEFEPYRTIYGALIEGEANCMGYARAMTYIMNDLGIECTNIFGEAVSGTGESGPHEWNAIKINGNWYQLDVCWDDPSFLTSDGDIQQEEDGFGVRHTYFNLTNEEMAKTRDFDESIVEVPECTAERDNYYVVNGYMMSSVADYEQFLIDNFGNMMEKGYTTEVRFANSTDYIKAVKGVSEMLDKAAITYQYSGTYQFQGYPDERNCILSCRLTPIGY